MASPGNAVRREKQHSDQEMSAAVLRARALRDAPDARGRRDADTDDDTSDDGEGEYEKGEEEEALLYFLLEHEFYAGGTCTYTPHRVVKRKSFGGAFEPRLLNPAEELPDSPGRDVPLGYGMPPRLPSRSELLPAAPESSDDELLSPSPRASAVPFVPRAPAVPFLKPFDSADDDEGWPARRWQPAPKMGEVEAATDSLLLAEGLRLLRESRLRRGLRSLRLWTCREATVLAARAARHWYEHTLALKSDAFVGWRDLLRKRTQQYLLLLSDTFRRLWVFTHTQRRYRAMLADDLESLALLT